jgi:hypothetical protein
LELLFELELEFEFELLFEFELELEFELLFELELEFEFELLFEFEFDELLPATMMCPSLWLVFTEDPASSW